VVGRLEAETLLRPDEDKEVGAAGGLVANVAVDVVGIFMSSSRPVSEA
jgi:hypothetical protein